MVSINNKSTSSWSLTSTSPLLYRQRKRSASTSSLPDDVKKKLNARDKKGRTQFFYAARSGDVQAARKLLEAGCDPNKADNNMITPLHEVMETSNAEMLDFLIDSGCDLNAKNILGQTPLMRAVLYDDIDSVRTLHKAGADLNERDCTGKTALLLGIQENRMHIVHYLIKIGCNVNLVDKLGQTALYIAMKEGKEVPDELVRKLLKAEYDLARDECWMRRPDMQRIKNIPLHAHSGSGSSLLHKIISKVKPKHSHDHDKQTGAH